MSEEQSDKKLIAALEKLLDAQQKLLRDGERKLEWCCRGSGVDEKNMWNTIPWEHVVRLSMQRLKKQGMVEKSDYGYWNILD